MTRLARATTTASPDVDLGGAWSFAITDRPVDLGSDPVGALIAAGATLLPAVVPGNLELDLERNGIIGDPFMGMDIVALRRYERSYVYYLRRFDAPDRRTSRPVLVFEGLDCDARVSLNGITVATVRNMLIEHRVPVGGAILDGAENHIVIEFAPVLARAASLIGRYPPGLVAEGGGYAGLHVRKAPHMFGWDIMPRALSAGIWRSVTLTYEAEERIDSVWLETERIAADHASATLILHYELTVEADAALGVELVISGSAEGSTFQLTERLLFGVGQVRFDVAMPQLWWPHGRGPATLYDVTLELRRDGRTIDTRTIRHGVRTIELDRTSVTDVDGNGEFRFIVNGEPIFILGTNWAPLDAYHSRDADRLWAALALVEELGCNMIRCWGGNVYEQDEFFDWCDHHGVLVWQDFAMACAIYPQDAAFQEVIADEVRFVVRRLRQHPSVAIWAGDNECDEQYVWKARPRDPNSNVLTRTVIPEVLRLEDPSRPYLPSSPYVDRVAYESGERSLPEDHLWGPRDYYKGPFYRDAVAHFASEIGYHGCPDVASLRRFLSADRLWPYSDNPEWLLHATSPFPGIDTHDYRVELMASQIRVLFGTVPSTLDGFVAASQASQSEALKFFIELFRAGKWRRTGIIWWNLIDGWPQMSDAIVDYYFTKKQAFETVRRAQVPVTLIVREASGGGHEVVLCNDSRFDIPMEYEIRDADTDRIVLDGAGVALGDAVVAVGSIPERDDQAMLLLSWRSDAHGTQRGHYLAGTPPFDLDRYRSWIGRAYREAAPAGHDEDSRIADSAPG